MTNYSKWDKFAKDLHSDTESEEEDNLRAHTGKDARHVHIPPKSFSTKEQLCQLFEEDECFEGTGEQTPSCQRYGWEGGVGSQFVPGYGLSSKGGGVDSNDHWRVYFDDMFLTTQKEPNPGARALLGTASLGSFVVACVDGKSGLERPISKKEVADLIMRRQEGLDAERIDLESQQQRKGMELYEKMGVETIEMGK